MGVKNKKMAYSVNAKYIVITLIATRLNQN